MTTKNKKRYKGLGYVFEEILAYYGVLPEDYSLCSDEYLRMACPVHGGDNATSFVWRLQYHSWACFSHGCHDTMDGNSAFHFILAMEDGDWQKAKGVAEVILSDCKNIISQKRQLRKKKFKRVRHEDQKEITELSGSRFTYSAYPDRRGISKALQRKYKIGIYGDLFPDKIGFPVFNRNGKIVGITLRKLHENDIGPKWVHKPEGYKSSVNLYNLHFANTYDGRIIVTEGPIDVLKLITCGFTNCVATFGCCMSAEQANLLSSIGTRKAIIAYDNDKPGDTGAQKTASTLQDYGIDSIRLRIKDHNDFGEMPLCLIKQRKWEMEEISLRKAPSMTMVK
jgi:5S rRNA maturation endonuclease (ribonuclease M5)